MVSNIIDLSPEINRTQCSYKVPWQVSATKIFGNIIKIYRLNGGETKINILLLHAYGGGCDGTDFNLHLNYLLFNLKANVFSVDLPGFGESEGKKFTSRA